MTEDNFWDEKTMDVKAECTCFSCGKKVLVGYEEGTPAVFHDLPYCAAFGELELLDFVTQCRQAFERAHAN